MKGSAEFFQDHASHCSGCDQCEDSEVTISTELALAKAIDYLSQREGKTKEEMIKILLVEALTARGMMTPMNKEAK